MDEVTVRAVRGVRVAAVAAGVVAAIAVVTFLVWPDQQVQPIAAPTAFPTATVDGAVATPTPQKSGTPTPSPSAKRKGCAATPSACGYPDATTTGVPAGTALTVVSGDLTITKKGAVVTGKDIRGCVLVKAPNVTIRKSKITCTSYYGIGSFAEEYAGGGLLVEDVEIDCQNHNTTGIGYYGTKVRRANIHGCENGFDIDDTTTVEDSYIHDLYEGATGHSDGAQFAGGAHIVLRHNTIFNPGGTSAIISHPTGNSDVLIADNFLAGGAYTLYCPREKSTAFRVIGNRFGRQFSAKGGAYGAWDSCGKIAERRGNFWDDTLKAVAS